MQTAWLKGGRLWTIRYKGDTMGNTVWIIPIWTDEQIAALYEAIWEDEGI
jgi:hypothetical protein